MRALSLATLALTAALVALPRLPALAQETTAPVSPSDPVVEGEGLEDLPALSGPMAIQDLLGLPVRTYGGAPPVAEIHDLLIKADGHLDKMVLDDGTFLRMGLDGKRVALPYAAATPIPGADGRPAYLRINIAKAYGQVIKEFLYELISPSDYAVKAILGAPLSAADAPGAARITGLTVTQGGMITEVELDLNPGSTTVAWPVHMPFAQLRVSRPGPKEETRLSTPLTLAQLRVLGVTSPGKVQDLDTPAPDAPIPSTPSSTPPSTPTTSSPSRAPASVGGGWTPGPGVVLPNTPPPDVPAMR